MPTPKILISSCLLGELVRYDGQAKPIDNPVLAQWLAADVLISICPEVSGGLPTPRPPAEIVSPGTVKTCEGNDVTQAFNRGAQRALAVCQTHEIKMAILKQSSPSCGSQWIYDGSFSGNKIRGEGVTCQLLRSHGIAVFCEQTLEEAATYYRRLTQVA